MSGPTSQQGEIEALAQAVALARQRADAGDLTTARTLLEGALATGELRLGPDHPQLVPLMVDLATIAREVGNLTESQAQLARAYGIAVTATGPEHPSALKIEARLAVVTNRLGDSTEVFDWHLADAGARVLGPEHVAVRSARERLGSRHGMGPVGTPSLGMAAPLDPAAAPPERRRAQLQPPDASQAHVPPPHPSRARLQSPGQPRGMPAGPPPTYLPSPRTPGVFDRRPDADAVYDSPDSPTEIGAQEIEVWSEPDEPTTRARSGRPDRMGLTLVGIGASVLIGGAIVAVKALGPDRVGSAAGPTSAPAATAGRAGAPTTPSTPTPAPTTPAALPPSDVTLADAGGSVTLTWRDPTAGRIPFLVSGGRVGTTTSPLDSVPAGRTRSIIYGLNSKFDYCFTVTAVYSTSVIASSMRICTHRLSTGNGT